MSDCTVLWESEAPLSKRVPPRPSLVLLKITREFVLPNVACWGSNSRCALRLKLSPDVPYFKGKAVLIVEMNDYWCSFLQSKNVFTFCTFTSFRYLRQTVDWPAEQDLGRLHKSPLINVLTKHTRRLAAALIRLWAPPGRTFHSW